MIDVVNAVQFYWSECSCWQSLALLCWHNLALVKLLINKKNAWDFLGHQAFYLFGLSLDSGVVLRGVFLIKQSLFPSRPYGLGGLWRSVWYACGVALNRHTFRYRRLPIPVKSSGAGRIMYEIWHLWHSSLLASSQYRFLYLLIEARFQAPKIGPSPHDYPKYTISSINTKASKHQNH